MTDTLAVRVTDTNHWPDDLPMHDWHDGVEYTFHTGRPIVMPLSAAKHIFGFSEETRIADFLHIQKRWGWNVQARGETVAEMVSRGRKWFAKLHVEPVIRQIVDIDASVTKEQLETALSLAREQEPALSTMM